MSDIVWRAIPEWQDYEVSRCGKVRRTKPGKRGGFCGERTPYTCNTGYKYICLRQGGRKKALAVHRLVAFAFIDPAPDAKPFVAHLNGNRTDNRAENLAWVSRSENEQHKILHGTSNRGERNRSARLTAPKVIEIRRLLSAGNTQSSVAKKYGVHAATIGSIAQGQSWGWLLSDDSTDDILERA